MIDLFIKTKLGLFELCLNRKRKHLFLAIDGDLVVDGMFMCLEYEDETFLY